MLFKYIGFIFLFICFSACTKQTVLSPDDIRNEVDDHSSKLQFALLTETPYSNPTISKVTLIGFNDDGLNTGMRLRECTKGSISDVLVYGFPMYGIRVSEQTTFDNVTNNELILSNSNLYNNGTDFKDCDSFIITNNGISTGSGTSWMANWTK